MPGRAPGCSELIHIWYGMVDCPIGRGFQLAWVVQPHGQWDELSACARHRWQHKTYVEHLYRSSPSEQTEFAEYHPAQELPGAPRPAVPGAGKAVEHWGGCKVCSVPRDKGTPREGRGQGHSAGGDGAHGDPENGRVI